MQQLRSQTNGTFCHSYDVTTHPNPAWILLEEQYFAVNASLRAVVVKHRSGYVFGGLPRFLRVHGHGAFTQMIRAAISRSPTHAAHGEREASCEASRY